MKFYSVPADFKLETIDEYDKLNKTYENAKVIETYGNITIGNLFESGRSAELLPEVDLLRLKEYIEYSHRKEIDFNYTINATTLNNREFTKKGVLKILNFLGKLHKIGVRSLTIALPSLIELVKNTTYDFNIKASTLCQITNTTKALAYKKMGVDRIVLDESLNKDFHTLKRIVNGVGDKVEIIANAICHKNCAYRMFHYNQMSADSIEILNQVSANYYSHRCVLQRYGNISNLLKLSWVRPEDIHYYTDIGIHYFKLQGRQAVLKGDPVRAAEAYFKESYDGNLFELLDMFNPTTNFQVFVDNKKLDGFLKPHIEIENFCKSDCHQCNYCETFAKKCIDIEKGNEIIKMANTFYNDYDQFKKMIASISNTKEDIDQKGIIEASFDL